VQITDINLPVIIFHNKVRREERIYTKWTYKDQRICWTSISVFFYFNNPTWATGLSVFCHNSRFHIFWENTDIKKQSTKADPLDFALYVFYLDMLVSYG